MERRASWCRVAECGVGVVAEVDGGRIRRLEADAASGLGHAPCATCERSKGARADPRRVLRPRRRQGDRWEETDWETALRAIAAKWKELRRQSGPAAVGLATGRSLGLDNRGTVRALSWPLATGSPGLYTPLADHGGPWVRAAELVLGHPVALQGDVERAHYLLLLGANQEAQGWGPMQLGRGQAAGVAHARQTRQSKLVAADPRRTALAAGANLHLPIRPGTELFLLLGMIRLVLDQGWLDGQYVADFCSPVGPLRAALEPWTPERCAEVCGIPATDLGGVALKFSRAAMAVAHRSPQALESARGTLTAWAMLVLHALTANLLRPGGLYENQGLLDLAAIAGTFPTDRAPRTRTGDFPLLLLQSPAAILADEVLVPGDGSLRGLLCLGADPLGDLPAPDRTREALAALDLLVVHDVADSATARLAHWVLPATHPWEEADAQLAVTAIQPVRHAQHTAAVVPAPGEARDVAWLLATLFKQVGPALRGSPFNAYVRLRGGRLVEADLDAWAARHLGGRGFPGSAALRGAPSGWDGGDVDRATWRISTPSGRIELLPGPIAEALAHLQPPAPAPGMDRWLLTSAARDPALRRFDRDPAEDPGVTLHPSCGLAEGARAVVRTAWGEVQATVRLDPTLRPDTVDLPRGYATPVERLVPATGLDPLVGTPAWNGLSCRVDAR